MIFETLAAIVKLGLPVAVLSWFILRRLYRSGELDPSDDRKEIDASLKRMRKRLKRGTEIDSTRSYQPANLLQARWLKFGAGFYGTAALWTFFVIELNELGGFLSSFTGFAALFEIGVVNLLVALFVNQVMNFVAAITWFRYWATIDSAIWLWMLIAYLGYLAGMYAARRDREF